MNAIESTFCKNPNKSFTVTGEKERKGADDGRCVCVFFLSGEGSIKQFLSDDLYFLFKIVVEDICEVGEDVA